MSTGSDRVHAVQVLTGIRVAMRDGVELNVRITRPDAPGRYPAVMEYHPYRRLAATLPDYVAVHPTLDIRIDATCQTASDTTSYTHLSTVRISVNGKPYFDKSWSESVPRKLS